MIKGLMQFVESLDGRVLKKKEVLNVIEQTIDSAANLVEPSLETMYKYSKDNNMPGSKITAINMLSISNKDFETKTLQSFMNRLRYTFSDLSKSLYSIEKIALKELPELIDEHSLTVRTASIMKVAYDINSMVMFCIDLLDLITIDIMDERSDIPKGKLQELTKGVSNFANLLSLYDGEIDQIVKDLTKVTNDELVLEESKQSMFAKVVSKNGKTIDFRVNSFIYNPIYHIRLFLVDMEMRKYENLKDKKELLELKVLELKSRAEGSHNPKLSKQIGYYEEKIAKTERKIRDVEES